eukprot:g14720.t1
MRFVKGRSLRALLSAALVGGGAFTSTLAQSDECAVSSAAGFDFEVTPADGFTMYWTVDADTQEITVQAVYEGEGYVAVGFSDTGAMFPGDAVIGLPDNGTVEEYDLTGYSSTSVTESANQEVTGTELTQTTSATTLKFTRPLAPTDTSKIVLSSEEGERTNFIYAWGQSNTLEFHGSDNRGSVSLSDLFCTTELSAADADADEDCTSSDPDYDFAVAPSGNADELELFWSVTGSSVSVKAVYQGEGWLGIGFSDSGNMPGSDAVIGLPDEETALEYDMDNYGTPVESAEQELTDSAITQANGVTTLTFVRPLEPTGDGKLLLDESTPSNWLYAWGGSNEFVRHSVDGAFSLSLDSCDVGAAGGGGTTEEYAHGWLMVLGWTLCFPAGILFARFSSSFKDVGFPAHRILQSLGSVLVVAGFIVAIMFTEDKGLDHFASAHGKAGLILTIFVMLQVVAAIFRPSKPPPGAVVRDENGHTKPQPPTKVRVAWSILHKGLGYIAFLWAILQCFGGLRAADAENVWALLYFLLAIAMVTAFVVLQTLACYRARERSPIDFSGPQHVLTGTETIVPSK